MSQTLWNTNHHTLIHSRNIVSFHSPTVTFGEKHFFFWILGDAFYGTPGINVSSNIVTVSWGQLEHFKCPDKNIQEISLRLIYKDEEIKQNLANFESKDLVLQNKKQLSCFPWMVHIKISMQFEKLDNDNAKCQWFFKNITNPFCQKLEDTSATFKQFINATEEPSTHLELQIIRTWYQVSGRSFLTKRSV